MYKAHAQTTSVQRRVLRTLNKLLWLQLTCKVWLLNPAVSDQAESGHRAVCVRLGGQARVQPLLAAWCVCVCVCGAEVISHDHPAFTTPADAAFVASGTASAANAAAAAVAAVVAAVAVILHLRMQKWLVK